jgi:hypothetical protein
MRFLVSSCPEPVQKNKQSIVGVRAIAFIDPDFRGLLEGTTIGSFLLGWKSWRYNGMYSPLITVAKSTVRAVVPIKGSKRLIESIQRGLTMDGSV